MEDYTEEILVWEILQDMQNRWLLYSSERNIYGLLKKDQVPWITAEDFSGTIDGLIIGVEKCPDGWIYTVDRGDKFMLEVVSELECVHDKLVQVDKVARIPGEKSKVLVTGDTGLFVGSWGENTKYLMERLHDKAIDVVKNSDSIRELIQSALGLRFPVKMEITEPARQVIVYIPKNLIGLAFGRGKINLTLAMRLIDWNISLTVLRDPFIYENGFPTDIIDDLVQNNIMTSDQLYDLIVEGNGKEILKAETVSYLEDVLEPGHEEESGPYECPQCGATFYEELTKCPECGCEFEYEEVEDES